MKKSVLFLFALLPLIALAQTKMLLHTISESEEFDYDNSKIIPTTTGASWEVVTVNYETKKYLSYTKTVKGKSIPVDIREDEFIITGKENGKEFFKVKSTGAKYGPYDGVDPRYDEEKKILYGYSYGKDGMNYYMDLINNKNYGPYYKGGVWLVDEKNFVYSNTVKNASTQKEEVFLFENDKKFGPYEQVAYKKSETGLAPLITYKENGKFYVNAPHCKGIAFSFYPTATEMKNGWLIEGTTEQTYKPQWYYLPDGKKFENSDKLKHTVNFQGDVMKLELVAGGGADAAYKVTYNGKEIGTYAVKKSYRSDQNKTDFFDHVFTEVKITGNWSLALREKNYLYSSSKGIVGPFTENELKTIFFFDNGYAAIKADSTLEMSGKQTLTKVTWADFKDYPNWWAFQKRGDYVYPFKNGTEVQVTEIPKRLRLFNTVDKEMVKVQRGDKFFYRLKGSDKLLGPVGQYDNSYVLSPDKKYFAFERGEDGFVVVNGKPVAKGNKIVYNEKLKTFYWFVLEGQKVYMYTHKLL